MRLISRLLSPLVAVALLGNLAFAQAAAPRAGTRPATTQSAAASTRPTTRPVLTGKALVATRPATPVKAQPETVADLRGLQAQVESVVNAVSPAVVGLRVGGGQGSGVIISADGFILTAGHVISAPGRDVTVLLGSGKSVKAKSLGVNFGPDSGLAKIVDSEMPPIGTGWPFVEMGRSGQLKRGDWCVTLGHPGGYKTGRTPPLRLGRVLDTRGIFLRTDCTLVGGDSGGPLFDLDGRVIGIHSRIGPTLNENMHVPVDSFRDTWDRLAKGEAWGGATFIASRPNAPYMGIQTDPELNDTKITDVNPDSPALKAGLKRGDVITSIGGIKVDTFAALLVNLQKFKPGQEVAVEFLRNDKPLKLNMTLGKRPGPG
jgi:serine protease Do